MGRCGPSDEPLMRISPGSWGDEGRIDLPGANDRAGKVDPDTHFEDSSAVVTVSRSSFHETMNLSTPSVSSSSVTSAYEMP
ncbi:hypothetical protein SAMN06295943_1201 [Agreia sp. VKM Ac-1783]|nr:hypothetical protein SAMN06295943_1201 [Agreia sp. VKM Ac-1783]